MNSTDVLKATCIPVEDRVYRLLPVRESLKNLEVDQPTSTYIDDDDDGFEPDVPVVHKGNTFYIVCHVPEPLIKHIVGQYQKTKKALEQQYDTNITIPHQKNIAAGITISGSTKKAVSLTYFSITRKVTAGRLRTESRHFISLPVNSPNIQKSFLKFREEILTKFGNVRGIDESIFQIPSKLHLTVSLLVLLDERDNQNAIALLTKCKDNVLKNIGEKEFVVQVKGIEYMNDDPAEVDILYARLQETDGDNSLQMIADRIMTDFVNASLSKRQHDKVKLHITLMNTLFRDNLESKDNKNDFDRITFDARPILKDYIDYDFGEITIPEIHISIRYTKSTNGYYSALHKMKLNL